MFMELQVYNISVLLFLWGFWLNEWNIMHTRIIKDNINKVLGWGLYSMVSHHHLQKHLWKQVGNLSNTGDKSWL